MRSTCYLVAAALLLASLAAPRPAGATNGMFLTAYGAETAGRAGANIARGLQCTVLEGLRLWLQENHPQLKGGTEPGGPGS